jgi:predicted GNAT superfamily acetyltransferase
VIVADGSAGTGGNAPSSDPQILCLESVGQQRAAAELYRSVFGYADDSFAVSPRLLRGLLENSGSALGAFDAGGAIIGFCYGFSAVDDGVLYHYSQATVIAPSAQGQGLGQALKRAQAAVASRTGAKTMRWSFDPVLSRNAHFNLNTLGARGKWFTPDFYGEPNTDRMIVEWELADSAWSTRRAAAGSLSARVEECASEILAATSHGIGAGSIGDLRWLALPSRLESTAAVAEPRARIRAELADAFAEGLWALSCASLNGVDGKAHPTGLAVYVLGRE